ncbi:MAG: DNA replication/repair protein RecF [Bdellovibrionia bacterium]
MYFSKVRLRNFRNLKELDTSFSPRLNVLLGQNGQGKTNVIEALYILLKGDSFRYSDNDTLITHAEESAHLAALLIQNDLEFSLKSIITKSQKQHFINNKKVNVAEVKKNFSAVLFSPESLSAIKESSENRRALVDDLLTTYEKNNSDLLLNYRKALKTRNKILKNFVQELTSKSETLALLESIDPIFLNLAAELTHKRLQALKSLTKDFNNAMTYISGESAEEITIFYEISGNNVLSFSLSEVSDLMRKRLQELQLAELSQGSSLVGPHKHDLKFLYGQNDSRFYCSQGQQRAIILSFKMAQIVYHRKAHGIYPVLMLDDVLSELDKQKRDALINFLHEINTQIFVTTTDLQLPTSFSLENTLVANVQNGSIMS